MSQQTFEIKFGQLAEAQLSESLPSIIDYYIGFQLLDSNKDETRAIGVLGFVLNNIWAYIPIFFLDGDIKGMDIMWLKNYDSVVPAKDNWVFVLRDRGEEFIGDLVLENDKDTYSPSDVDITNMNEGNTGEVYGGKVNYDKEASANAILSPKDVEAMFKTASIADKEVFSLFKGLHNLGSEASVEFCKLFKESKDFANSVLTYHDPKDVISFGEDLKLRLNVSKLEKTASSKGVLSDVSIIKEATDPNIQSLSNTEKRAFLKNDIFIKDARDVTTRVYFEGSKKTLENPTEPGLYSILLSDGTFKDFYVIPLLNSFNSYDVTVKDNPKRLIDCALIDASGSIDAEIFKLGDVFAKPIQTVDITKLLSKGASPSKSGLVKASKNSSDDPYSLSKDASCICVSGDGKKAYALRSVNNKTPVAAVLPGINSDTENPDRDVNISFTGDSGKLSLEGNILFIPEDARFFNFKLRDSKLNLGDLNTIHYVINKSAGLSDLEIFADADLFRIFASGKDYGLQKRADALESLVLNQGIFAGMSQKMLNDAKSTGRTGYLLKYAKNYPRKSNKVDYPKVPHKMDSNNSTKSVVGGSALKPQRVVDAAIKASETGIKDVFDVSILQSLLSLADPMEINSNYVSELFKATDTLGRMLFVYYWYNKEYSDRYGKGDFLKIENTIKEIFLKSGDLVLYLKEKNIFSNDDGSIEGELI